MFGWRVDLLELTSTWISWGSSQILSDHSGTTKLLSDNKLPSRVLGRRGRRRIVSRTLGTFYICR